MKVLADYFRLLRPQQWIKNFFVFAGLIFSLQFRELSSVKTSIFAFLVFCILSSGCYIWNDIIDYAEDREHPIKSKRPIAAGRIGRRSAAGLAIVLIVISLLIARYINRDFSIVCSVYAVMMLLYSIKIKDIVLLDVMVVALGYVLRAIAGTVAIGVEISSWLLLCTFLLALFIVISKRRTEIISLGDDAVRHRKILAQYSIDMLNAMMAIVTSACIVAYCLYTLAPETIAKFNTRDLIFTVPFVIYGIFRYLYITYRKVETDIPEKVLTTDLPLQLCLALWIIVCILILANVKSY